MTIPVLLVCCLLHASPSAQQGAKEPSEKTDRAIRQMARSADPRVRREAIRVVRASFKVCNRESSAELLAGMIEKEKDDEALYDAIAALCLFGDAKKSEAAVPKLVSCLSDDFLKSLKVRSSEVKANACTLPFRWCFLEATCRALSSIGRPAIPQVEKLLKDRMSNAARRERALYILGEMPRFRLEGRGRAETASAVAPLVTGSLEDPDRNVRILAVRILKTYMFRNSAAASKAALEKRLKLEMDADLKRAMSEALKQIEEYIESPEPR